MKAKIGSISHGTLRPEDLIPDLIEHIRALDSEGRFNSRLEELEKELETYEEIGELADPQYPDEVVVELMEILGEFAPPYMYFGTRAGDGAGFGFWLSEDWKRQMEEDDVLFVDDTGDERIQGHVGYVAHANDHGNLTLYRTKVELEEIWGVV